MILRSRASCEGAHAIDYPVLDQARRDLDARLAEATAAGRAAGLAEAQARITAAESTAATALTQAAKTDTRLQAEYEQRLGQAIQAFAHASTSLEDLHRQLVVEAEQDIARLALLIAGRILHREIDDDPTWMEPVLAEALARVPDKRGVAVRLHPEDAAVASERKRIIADQVPGLERLEFFADDALPRGACVIASQGTRLESSLGATLARFAVSLLDEQTPTLTVAPRQDDPS